MRAVIPRDPSNIEELDMVREFLLESSENLARLERDIAELRRHPRDADIHASIFRTFHTIKGSCGFLGFTRLEAVAHDTEDLLSQIRAGQCEPDTDFIARILTARDALVSSLDRIEQGAGAASAGSRQPLAVLWNKVPRLVQFLGQSLGKQLRVELDGIELELNAATLEAIGDPLVHLIRNACDHGIEAPEERVRIGKPPCGTVYLRAYRDRSYVVVEVADDGAGIDANLLDVVFDRGFSTAKEVTSISGRGVGMDVVRSNIERIGGTVEITTTPGEGTAVKLRIPAASQIHTENYRYLQNLIHIGSGIVLDDGKHHLLESRLLPLAREQGAATLNDLCALLRRSRETSLKQKVIAAMTTNETYFFREFEHYEALRRSIIPQLLEVRCNTRRLRFWSAASSTGQEAYSLAMLLLEMGLGDWDIEILGTDLCSPVLERARGGIFSRLEMTRGLPASYAAKYFDPIGPQWQVKNELKRMVRFQAFDLRSPMCDLGPFDAVFCRNVLIYFDRSTKTKIIESLHRTLAPGGHLFLGSAETTLPTGNRFERKSIGSAVVYQAH